MKKTSIILLFLLSTLLSWADSAIDSYFIKFTNKNGTAFSIDKPEEFLSEKAIARRAKLQIAIDSTDLPLSKIYLDSITTYGAKIIHQIKWQNGAIVEMTGDIANSLSELDFIDFIELTKINSNSAKSKIGTPIKTKNNWLPTSEESEKQKQQLGVDKLHKLGFRGKGITIAIIDAGFYNADKMEVFDSLRNSGQLLGTYDFANPTSNIYDEDYHGTYVLSTMAANSPTKMIGTAPDANYYLLRTEISDTEWLLEVDLYCSALEWADSAGVDLINTSLGYAEFDDANMNFTYDDLDGKTIRSSISASMAVKKGMFLISSAGNEGNKNWHYIASPADAKGVLTVGSVDSLGVASYFSSYGPTADGRIKPEVVATGSSCVVVNTNNSLLFANGTSFSAPVMAGMVASLMSAMPNITPTELYTKICTSASQYLSPTDNLGYGIPNAMNIYNIENNIDKVEAESTIYITQDSNYIQLHNLSQNTLVKIYDINGEIIFIDYVNNEEYIYNDNWHSGIYIIQVNDQNLIYNSKIVVTK